VFHFFFSAPKIPKLNHFAWFFIISDSFFLSINTYQRVIFDGFLYASRTIGYPSADKTYKSAQRIKRQMNSACRKIQSCKVFSNFLQDA
jgi:hypothetical protein